MYLAPKTPARIRRMFRLLYPEQLYSLPVPWRPGDAGWTCGPLDPTDIYGGAWLTVSAIGCATQKGRRV